EGLVPRLYRNLGRLSAKGTGPLPPGVPSPLRTAPATARFEDVTVKSGLGRFPSAGLGVVCADFDGDGWPDVFVANDGRKNWLFINQHNGTFKEDAVVRGVAYDRIGRAPANMGIGLGDVNGDGLFDLFVTHLTEENHSLWQQGPRGLFEDRT